MVNYDSSSKTSIDEELVVLLSETDLKFKVFDHKFVILFKDSREGLESLKEMMKHFKQIIKEKEVLQAKERIMPEKGAARIDSTINPNLGEKF